MIKGDGTDKAKRPCCLNRLEAIRRSSILVGLRGYRLHRGRQREAQESGPDIMDTSTCYKQGDGSETSGRLWRNGVRTRNLYVSTLLPQMPYPACE